MNKFLSVSCLLLSVALYGSWKKETTQNPISPTESVTSHSESYGKVFQGKPQIVYVPIPGNQDVWCEEYHNGLPYWKNLTTGNYLYINPPK